jgi:REP element-mobilizing transposase RayT
MSGIRKRRSLPHWEADNGIYFVTYRLFDSLPASKVRRITQQLALDDSHHRRLSKRLELLLDSGAGECHLASPQIAAIVAESLKNFDEVRYRLQAWCIMPNHIHVVVMPLQEWNLEKIVHTWKSFTATQANRALNRHGEFWQREYYDHLIRDGQDLARIVEYVRMNPQKANLQNWPWVWTRP